MAPANPMRAMMNKTRQTNQRPSETRVNDKVNRTPKPIKKTRNFFLKFRQSAMVPSTGARNAKIREAVELAKPQLAVETALGMPWEATSLKKMGITVVMITKTKAELATSYNIQLRSVGVNLFFTWPNP